MLYKIKNISRDTINLHGRLIHPKEEIKTAVIEPYRIMLEKGFLKIISEEQDSTIPNIPSILYVNSQRKGEMFSKPFAVMNSNINEKLRNRLKIADKQQFDISSTPIKSEPTNSSDKSALQQVNFTDALLNDVTIVNNIENISTIEDAYRQQYSNLNDNNILPNTANVNQSINIIEEDNNSDSSDNIPISKTGTDINLSINEKTSFSKTSKSANKDKRFDTLYNMVVKSLSNKINNVSENILNDTDINNNSNIINHQYTSTKSTSISNTIKNNLSIQATTLIDFINIIMQKINADYYKGFSSTTDNITIDDLIYKNNLSINANNTSQNQVYNEKIFEESKTTNNQNKALLKEMEQLLDDKLNILTQQNMVNNSVNNSNNLISKANISINDATNIHINEANINDQNDEIIQSLFHLFIDRSITDDDLQNIKEFYYRIHLLDNIPTNIKEQIDVASSYEELITILLNTVYPFLLTINNDYYNKDKKQ